VDRLTRHELKSDQFVEQVGQIVENVEAHRAQVIRYSIAAAAVLLIAGGSYWFVRSRQETRQAELAKTLRVWTAPVGGTPGEYSFATADAKQKAIEKVIPEFVAKYAGSKEAAVGDYLLGIRAADQNRFDEAEQHLKAAADGGSKEYGSLAKLALAEVYAARGKNADAEKLLKELIDKPTALVSKDQATISLARLYLKTKPAEANKLLDPLLHAPDTTAGSIATALIHGDASSSQ